MKLYKLAIVIVLLLIFSSCGGGGGGNKIQNQLSNELKYQCIEVEKDEDDNYNLSEMSVDKEGEIKSNKDKKCGGNDDGFIVYSEEGDLRLSLGFEDKTINSGYKYYEASPSDITKTLNGDSCKITNEFEIHFFDENPKTSVNLREFHQTNPDTGEITNIHDIIKDISPEAMKYGYDMKTLVFGAAKSPNGEYFYFLPDNVDPCNTYSYNYQNNGVTYNQIKGKHSHPLYDPTLDKLYSDFPNGFPYMLLNNEEREIKFDYDKIIHKLSKHCFYERDCGNYQFDMFVIPIDGKCDLNGDGTLEVEVFSESILPKNIQSNNFLTIDTSDDYNVNKMDITFLREVMINSIENFEDDDFGDDSSDERLRDSLKDRKYGKNKYYWENVEKGISHDNGWFLRSLNSWDVDSSVDPEWNSICNGVESDPEIGYSYHIDPDFSLTPVKVPEIDKFDNIDIYKNGVLDRVESVDPIFMLREIHKVRKLKDGYESETFLNQSVRLMEELEIKKDIDYNSSRDVSKITLTLNNIKPTDKNLNVYQIIPKSFAQKFEDLNIVSSGNGRLIVIDKDPVISWHFENPSDTETIVYEVPGNNEGGYTIITKEPILYNGGKLIVNYREKNCNAGEVNLFELDDIVNSSVYSPGSGKLYKVCLTHLEEDLYDGGVYPSTHEFLSYNDGGNVSVSNMSGYSQKVSASVANSSYYWDVKVQKDNPGDMYTCIGSVTDTENSLFGDCGFTENRIWLHLDKDEIAPNTSITVSVPSNSMHINMTAKDNLGGSGVEKLIYCVDENNTCNSFNEEFKSNFKFTISCPDYWGCIKFLRYKSADFAGNEDTLKSYKLTLLQKGSSCQADCTAKPLPGRFVKECNNLNGCTYLNIGDDEGKTIAERCDYLVPGSYVEYNSSHDVMCPNGPFRKSNKGTENIRVDANCDNVLIKEYPVIIEGEQSVLKIFTCD